MLFCTVPATASLVGQGHMQLGFVKMSVCYSAQRLPQDTPAVNLHDQSGSRG